MARQKIKSDDIDGFQYEVMQMGAVEGRKVYAQVLKIVLPAIGAALTGRDMSSISKADVAGMALDEVARALAMGLDTIDPIITTMARWSDIYGPGFGDQPDALGRPVAPAGAPLTPNFDEHFAGRYAAMTRWLLFALKVQLWDFFDGKASVQSMLAGLAAAKASPSQST